MYNVVHPCIRMQWNSCNLQIESFDIMISAEIALMTDQWWSWSSIGLVWQQLAEVAEVASALCYANQPDL